MKPKTTTTPPSPSNFVPIGLAPQTGMPPIYSSRSRELLYDTLMQNFRFRFNRFGPQTLNVARKENRW